MIALSTTIFDGNYDVILNDDSWFLNYEHNLVKIKLLIVNNIQNQERIDQLVSKIDNYKNIQLLFVDEHKDEAKKLFNLDINEHTLGYYYTIPYFVALLKCTQPFLFNVSSDCKLFFQDDYLYDSISELNLNESAITSTLPWREHIDVGKHEQDEDFQRFNIIKPELELFNYSARFSDQVFLANVEKLKNIDFNLNHPDTHFYPAYGGNCFEKRVCNYFFTYQKFRLVYKKYHYIHG